MALLISISFSFSALAFALFLAVASVESHGSSEEAQFTYSGPNGTSQWGNLSSENSACSNGKFQSPININTNETVIHKTLKPLTRQYKSTNATLVYSVVHVGVKYEGELGTLIVDDKKYSLKQMHWHSPSEHKIDGVQYPLELHLVHEGEHEAHAVVSILYQLGLPDPFFDGFQTSLTKLHVEVKAGYEDACIPLGFLNIRSLGKKTRKYYKYMGSLTTPPCTEGVVWIVLSRIRSVSQEQIEAMKAPLGIAYKENGRPVQPLNERKVELCTEYDQKKKQERAPRRS